MKNKILLFALVFILYFAKCALMVISDPAEIKGRIILSDNPSSGYGGTIVRTDTKSTRTDKNGEFSLEGWISSNEDITIYFEHQGYRTTHIELGYDEFHKENEDKITLICDIGEIELEKIYTNVYESFDDGNAN